LKEKPLYGTAKNCATVNAKNMPRAGKENKASKGERFWMTLRRIALFLAPQVVVAGKEVI